MQTLCLITLAGKHEYLRQLYRKYDISHLYIPSPLDNQLPRQPSIVNADFSLNNEGF